MRWMKFNAKRYSFIREAGPPLDRVSGAGASGPRYRKKIKFSRQKIEKTGGKYKKWRKMAFQSEHSTVVWNVLECHSRKF
jgi:hypothetical protein